jgi:hypothetical protein
MCFSLIFKTGCCSAPTWRQSFVWFYCRLTDFGRSQCEEIRPELENFRFDLVLVSPLSRALETASLVLDSFKDKVSKCFVCSSVCVCIGRSRVHEKEMNVNIASFRSKMSWVKKSWPLSFGFTTPFIVNFHLFWRSNWMLMADTRAWKILFGDGAESAHN